MHISPRLRRLLIAAAGYALALAAGIAVLGVGEVENILASPQAVLRFSIAGGVWMLLAYVALPRLLSPGARRTAVRGVVVSLALAGALASTLRTTTVRDVAPDLAAVAPVAAAAAVPGPSASRSAAGATPSGATPSVGTPSGGAPVKRTSRAPAGTPTAAASAPPAPPAPAAPVRLGTGRVAGINHKGAGSATLIRLADGSHVVRFEGLDVDNAPDMRVWLVRGGDREKTRDGVDLGKLKGNKGDQNYAAPAGTAVAPGEWTVLIWCRAFAVPIANATLTVA